MQRFLILLVILAIAVGVYFMLDQGDPAPDPSDDNGGKVDDGDVVPAPPPENAETLTTARTGPLPEPEVKQLKMPTGLLMIAGSRDPWTALLELTFTPLKDLEYRTWYQRDPQNPERKEGAAGVGRGLKALTAPPTADYLESEDIRVLIVDQTDPNALTSAFWDEVANRVSSGRMGLYVRPGFPVNVAGQAEAVHPVLTHPALKGLLPVIETTPIQGQPLAGVFKKKQMLAPTPEGTRHAATRLVDDPRDSLDIWRKAATGDGSWGTTFCYPVLKVRPGATVLANIEAATSNPALIVSAAPMRVLWQGNIDFGGRETHFTPNKDKLRRILLMHWWVWLAGQAE